MSHTPTNNTHLISKEIPEPTAEHQPSPGRTSAFTRQSIDQSKSQNWGLQISYTNATVIIVLSIYVLTKN